MMAISPAPPPSFTARRDHDAAQFGSFAGFAGCRWAGDTMVGERRSYGERSDGTEKSQA